jgi:hypothetical protein
VLAREIAPRTNGATVALPDRRALAEVGWEPLRTTVAHCHRNGRTLSLNCSRQGGDMRPDAAVVRDGACP